MFGMVELVMCYVACELSVCQLAILSVLDGHVLTMHTLPSTFMECVLHRTRTKQQLVRSGVSSNVKDQCPYVYIV